jgi:hypothetical protein
LIVTFSARGTVQPSGSQVIPIVFIRCDIDGAPCQPNGNPVEFLYPQFCCDTRSFTWVADTVPAGMHTVTILWGMGESNVGHRHESHSHGTTRSTLSEAIRQYRFARFRSAPATRFADSEAIGELSSGGADLPVEQPTTCELSSTSRR